MQKFSGSGVFQGEQIGVQGLPAEGGECILTLAAEVAGLGLEVRAIDGIAHQGVADMAEVHPDLMGSPGLELAGEKRGDRLAVAPLIRRLQFPMRDRLASARTHRHFFAGIGMPVDRRVDRAALPAGHAQTKAK